jgi:hypothetical protein
MNFQFSKSVDRQFNEVEFHLLNEKNKINIEA